MPGGQICKSCLWNFIFRVLSCCQYISLLYSALAVNHVVLNKHDTYRSVPTAISILNLLVCILKILQSYKTLVFSSMPLFKCHTRRTCHVFYGIYHLRRLKDNTSLLRLQGHLPVDIVNDVNDSFVILNTLLMMLMMALLHLRLDFSAAAH